MSVEVNSDLHNQALIRSDSSSTSPFLLFVVNEAKFFLSHRRNIALAAKQRGYRVGVACPPSPELEDAQKLGFEVFPLTLTKWGWNPLQELVALRGLIGLYRTVKPDIVHHVTIKPVIYGSVAARLAKTSAVVNAVPGLGHVFSSVGIGASVRRQIVKSLYRIAFRHPRHRVIFQNEDDRKHFVTSKLVSPELTTLINGSGVNTEDFSPSPEPDGDVKVLFSGRLLWKKGLGEFVDAARQLHRRGISVQFLIAGEAVPKNPGGVSSETLEEWCREGIIKYLGYRKDMANLLREVHIVCLPSYYGEGVPKALIEAASAGRPIITTDSSGCRSIVIHNSNGLLIPSKDSVALADAVIELAANPIKRAEMGLAGRSLVTVGGFSEEVIVAKTCKIYEELLASH